ncbi:MAG: hypothetical protein JO273_21775 [Methylobacteriaceae bacterium]|nr:hypothetical protein [Methylobacteriaceae bacterium]
MPNLTLRISAIGLAVAVALTPALAASAKYRWHVHRHHARVFGPSRYYGYMPYGAAPYSAACVRWCANDSNPCDPPYFKQADGRCFDHF